VTGEAFPLEPSSEEMRTMAGGAVEAIVEFVEGLPSAPASDRDGASELAARLREEAPEFGESFDKVLASVLEASSKGIETGGPGFFGFIPGGGLYASAIAAYVAFAMNRFVNMWETAPALAQIEATVLRWFSDLFDYPPETLGILTSGGSIANLSAIVTARKALLGSDFLDGTLYTSEHAHASVVKAAIIAGFPQRNVRIVPTTSDLRIDVEALHAKMDADRREGFRPFCVIGNAGTTNTGTVDPLVDLVQIAHERRMWLHVDAAYGGFFQLTERGRRALRGIAGADSITLDPHKGMFLPYGTGALLVRDGGRLRDAHHIEAHYLQDMHADEEIPSFTHYGPELSRDFRGLRVWFPVKLHGLQAFRDALDEKLDLARLVYDELSSTPGFELPWEPDLTVVPFRYRFRTIDDETGNTRLLDEINATKRVFLTSTRIDGRFTLRVCILSHRSHRDRVEECIEIIRRTAAAIDR
jgi:aromatic-L-amino-acid/L-tryptophan decarboxylase